MRTSIQDLLFSFNPRSFSLHIPHLEIESGSKTAIVGPSGSGKTTLLRLLSGIYIPQGGRIQVGDHEVGKMSDTERRRFRIQNIGFVFQEFELLDYLNVRENIRLPFRINRHAEPDTHLDEAIEELAKDLGFRTKLERRIDALSQGEKQRVAVARALLTKPGLLLADEPTGNLDPENKSNLRDLLFSHSAKNHSTLIVVTHDHSLLDGFDRVIDFEDFRIKGDIR